MSALHSIFGFSQFRPGQEQTVNQLLNGHSSLAIFPTGSGKSLCYQYSATQLPHLTLLVSPLLALMKDQLAFLHEKGIAAASIDSSLSPQENQQVMAEVRAGKIKILMISVERFKNERFRQFIAGIPISMLVVDEAHCISEWGHNFRPDYLKLPQYKQELNIPLVLLLTATATKKVKKDMCHKFAIEPQHVVQTGFYRPNLDLNIIPLSHDQRDSTLLQLIEQQAGSGIVYVTLQQTAENLAHYLTEQGIHAMAYHAGFDSEKRKDIQNQFMAGHYQVVVATIAFGMGIDKSDIRFVIHYDLPKSIENYSQEIGRAGRDGAQAQCHVLANLDGINTVENFVYGDTPEYTAIKAVIDNILTESQQHQWETQLIPLSNQTNIRQLALKTLLVQLEIMGAIKPLYSYFAEFKIKLLATEEEILAAFNVQRQTFLKQIFEHTQFKKIWGSLNFDSLYQAYGSDRQRVISALEYLHEKNFIQLESKGMTEVYAISETILQQANLAEQLSHYFNQKEESEIQRIAALVRFFELDSCLSWNLARYFDDQAAPQPCGHCSVCRGNVAKLHHSHAAIWPSDEFMQSNMQNMSTELSHKKGLTEGEISPALMTRFLLGISVPVFARTGLRKMSGWASCEHLRYQEVLNKVQILQR